MKSTLSYFYSSFLITFLAIAAGYYFGGMPGLFAVLMLGLLETSLSVDNAVVNAKQLNKMDVFWRKMFLTVGMIIAVFGMRIVFPIVIVACTTGLGMWEVSLMAWNEPTKYAEVLTATHTMIAGFGGAFLMLVFLKFFLDAEKDVHWVAAIEGPLAKIGNAESIQVIITMVVLYFVSQQLPSADMLGFILAGAAGIITFVLVDSLELLTGNGEEPESSGGVTTVVKSGLMGFIYLEVLDASFSFDGVIGAFAITNNILVIALGLGIGAMFVRSMTLMLVDKGTLAEFKFLEHGAFYAIGALATIMFVSTFHHMSEMISGTIGAAFIGMALLSSIMHNRKEAALVAA